MNLKEGAVSRLGGIGTLLRVFLLKDSSQSSRLELEETHELDVLALLEATSILNR